MAVRLIGEKNLNISKTQAKEWIKEFQIKLFELHLIADGNDGCKINKEAAIKLDKLRYEFEEYWKKIFNL